MNALATGFNLLKLNYIFEQRWVASEEMAVQRIFHNWILLVQDLEDIIAPTNKAKFEKAQTPATGLLKQIKSRSFLAGLALLWDCLETLKYVSVRMQKSGGLLVGKKQ